MKTPQVIGNQTSCFGCNALGSCTAGCTETCREWDAVILLHGCATVTDLEAAVLGASAEST